MEYQLRPGLTGSIEKDRKTLHGTAEQRGGYKQVANGGIVAVELSALGLEPIANRGRLGTRATTVGTHFK